LKCMHDGDLYENRTMGNVQKNNVCTNESGVKFSV
jgi:hypothetical protein